MQEPAAGATFACHVATIAGDGRDSTTRLLRERESTIWDRPNQCHWSSGTRLQHRPVARAMAAAPAAKGIYASLGSLLDEALRATGEPAGEQQQSVPGSTSQDDPLQELEAAASAIFVASCVVVVVFYCARGLFTLGLLLGLGTAFLQNPAKDPALRVACWEPLLSARHALLGDKVEDKLHRGKLFSALKAAVMDGGVRLARGKRVLVDFMFLCIAYVESNSKLDQDLCALGCFGSWYIIRSNTLRNFAAGQAGQFATTTAPVK